ncbi:MAG: serine/threonine protein kinase [Nitrospirae bacterium]|nr:serine/threonine protein kinase [Candidatus Troglogloeales bacterium]
MPEEIFFSDKYKSEGEIASGGMGTLYKGLDIALDRPVAIKVPHPHYLKSDPDFSRRFLREGRAMARLDHENIIRVFGVEGEPAAPFIVMEYFEGKNLKQLLAEKGTFFVLDALLISIQMANALGYAHSKGIIHRDIKPANVMVSAAGKVKIADFGIAAVRGEDGLTTAGTTIGTSQYMSPEQARGKSIDGRADLYSMGMVLYEILTGSTPYKGQSFESIVGRLVQAKEDYTLTFPRTISQSLQELIITLLKKDPDKRIQDAHKVSERLEKIKIEVAESLKIISNEFTQIYKAPLTKSPFVATVAGISAFVVVVGGLVYTFWAKENILVPTSDVRAVPARPITSLELPQFSPPSSTHTKPKNIEPVPISVPGTPQKNKAVADQKQEGVKPFKQAPALPTLPKVEKIKEIPSLSQALPNLISSPPQKEPEIIPDSQRVSEIFENLKHAIEQKDMETLRKITVMSAERTAIMELVFLKYRNIAISITQPNIGQNTAQAFVVIEKLRDANGNPAFPGPKWKEMAVKIQKEETDWGKVIW